jgi:DNA-binding transcriptional ArsR family regulator
MPTYAGLPELGPEQLKALTHPLRVRLLKELRADGPATASLLGRRLGESSGATSYHLRQLAKHGFVEEVPDEGDGRDRWWRPAFGGHTVETAKWLDDPEQRAVLAMYEAGIVATYAGLLTEWIDEQHEWPRPWADAADLSDFRLRLTPDRLRRFTEAVHALAQKYERYADADGGEQVVVLFSAFPRQSRPFAEEAE